MSMWLKDAAFVDIVRSSVVGPKAPHEVRCSASGGRHTVQKEFGLGTTRGGPVV